MSQHILRAHLDLGQTGIDAVNEIPEEFFLSSSALFLDKCMAGGQFLRLIAEKLDKYGHSKENINTRLIGIEESEGFINIAKNQYNTPGRFFVAKNKKEIDEIIKGMNMEFNVVVGNYPFSKEQWKKHLDTSLNISNRCVIAISPDGTGNFSKQSKAFEQKLIDNNIQKKVDCTNNFSTVNSGKLVYYVFDFEKPANLNYLNDGSLEYSIMKKIMAIPGPRITAMLSKNRSTNFTKSPRHEKLQPNTIKNIDSITQKGIKENYIDKDIATIIDGNKYRLYNRHFGKNVINPMCERNEEIGIGTNVLAIEKTKHTKEEFESIVFSKTIKFYLKIIRSGNSDTSPLHLAQVPLFKEGIIWNDQSISKLANFSTAEEELIETTTEYS